LRVRQWPAALCRCLVSSRASLCQWAHRRRKLWAGRSFQAPVEDINLHLIRRLRRSLRSSAACCWLALVSALLALQPCPRRSQGVWRRPWLLCRPLRMSSASRLQLDSGTLLGSQPMAAWRTSSTAGLLSSSMAVSPCSPAWAT